MMAEALAMSSCISSCLILKEMVEGVLVVVGDVIITTNAWTAGFAIFQANRSDGQSQKLDL